MTATSLRPALAERLDAVARAVAARPDALDLLGLGSIGEETERADAWSDLDFFVIVQPSRKNAWLARLDWLTAAHPLAWSFANTADGHKALMADGLLCEFAVFEPQGLRAVPYAPGRSVWRRDDTLPDAWATPAQPLPAQRDAN